MMEWPALPKFLSWNSFLFWSPFLTILIMFLRTPISDRNAAERRLLVPER